MSDGTQGRPPRRSEPAADRASCHDTLDQTVADTVLRSLFPRPNRSAREGRGGGGGRTGHAEWNGRNSQRALCRGAYRWRSARRGQGRQPDRRSGRRMSRTHLLRASCRLWAGWRNPDRRRADRGVVRAGPRDRRDRNTYSGAGWPRWSNRYRPELARTRPGENKTWRERGLAVRVAWSTPGVTEIEDKIVILHRP